MISWSVIKARKGEFHFHRNCGDEFNAQRENSLTCFGRRSAVNCAMLLRQNWLLCAHFPAFYRYSNDGKYEIKSVAVFSCRCSWINWSLTVNVFIDFKLIEALHLSRIVLVIFRLGWNMIKLLIYHLVQIRFYVIEKRLSLEGINSHREASLTPSQRGAKRCALSARGDE